MSTPGSGAGVVGWSDKKPPKGWSEAAYDSGKTEPAFGNKFTGDKNEPYNSLTDPHHPLKNPNKEPDRGWQRAPGSRKDDNSPGFFPVAADWDWGERFFEQEFPVVLNIRNHCKTTQQVSIFIRGLPYLTLPSRVSVPPSRQGVDVPGKVKLPGPPFPSGRPGEPAMGWVDMDPGYIPPGMPPPKLHQPNYVSIMGEVVVWHPWSADARGEECLPVRTSYAVGGHMHWRPPEPDSGPAGPSGFAEIDPCTVWWNTGEEPPREKGDCTRSMQLLAEHFMEKVLPPYQTNSPQDWAWLTAFGGVRDKTITELLEMKYRASVLMGQAS
ncbi:MAG: hypothetical protein RJQ10_05860 [Haliea sp.]|uniref:hypothetical protein n=1 Tax=Haliea sp. TaxID=1932666 RepID=UPI0032EDC00C